VTEVNQTVSFGDAEVAHYIYGNRDANLKLLEQMLDLRIGARGEQVSISGGQSDVEVAALVLEQLYSLGEKGFSLSEQDVKRSVEMIERDPSISLEDIFLDTVFVSVRNRSISPKGINQKRYVDAMRRNDIVFGIGPAGTGKTYLAMAMALAHLFEKKVKRIIITRPAVEAGEKLGFLPGDMMEKVNPYLRPLHDALFDMVESEKAENLIERGVVEVAPLAFMRGRTLNDSFIVLDEAQNATREQMKMFLTRIGESSKAAITGDITQVDLPSQRRSGLVEVNDILRGIPGIAFCEFSQRDVVRHPLVQEIIMAYERANEATT
jgi:phosphate starvation-inducible PhoH-like protein